MGERLEKGKEIKTNRRTDVFMNRLTETDEQTKLQRQGETSAACEVVSLRNSMLSNF